MVQLNNFHVSAYSKINKNRGDIARINAIINQGTNFRGAHFLWRFIHRRNGHARIGITAFRPPQGEHYNKSPYRKRNDGIAADKTNHLRDSAWLVQHTFLKIDINRQSAAQRERPDITEAGSWPFYRSQDRKSTRLNSS